MQLLAVDVKVQCNRGPRTTTSGCRPVASAATLNTYTPSHNLFLAEARVSTLFSL
jgi:hypothetical protein